jgi:hypothetical protein
MGEQCNGQNQPGAPDLPDPQSDDADGRGHSFAFQSTKPSGVEAEERSSCKSPRGTGKERPWRHHSPPRPRHGKADPAHREVHPLVEKSFGLGTRLGRSHGQTQPNLPTLMIQILDTVGIKEPPPCLRKPHPRTAPHMKTSITTHVEIQPQEYDPNGNKSRSERGNLLEINTVTNRQRRTISNKCATFEGAQGTGGRCRDGAVGGPLPVGLGIYRVN